MQHFQCNCIDLIVLPSVMICVKSASFADHIYSVRFIVVEQKVDGPEGSARTMGGAAAKYDNFE